MEIGPWSSALAIIYMLVASAGASEYVRPPPGKIIKTPGNKPQSHPEQVHISAVGADHMRVSWITEDKHALSLVEYGKSPGAYSASAIGEHTSYRYFFYTSSKIHHVKIGPLDSNTVYYYRCGGTGNEFSFKTAPATLPVKFVIIGDLGQTEWTASTLSHINKTDFDMLLLPGDLSYADTLQPLWDSFGRFVEPYASRRPWMVTEGNHDVESFEIFHMFNFHPFASYNARWRMPFEESGSTSNLYYSFDVAGGVHVIMLGSYVEYGSASEQYRWLEGDLAAVNRGQTPWVIVLLHTPWYSTNSAHQGEGEQMRKAMEGLLYGARVDAVFSGHVHAYERFTKINDNKANQCGPTYITIGDGGNREGLALEFEKNHKSVSLSLFREASFGHGQLMISNQTHARWSWHRNNDQYSVIADEVWLKSLSTSKVCGSVYSSSHPSLSKDEL